MPTGQGTDYCHNAIAGCFSKPANPVQWRIRYIRFSHLAAINRPQSQVISVSQRRCRFCFALTPLNIRIKRRELLEKGSGGSDNRGLKPLLDGCGHVVGVIRQN